MSAGHSSVHSVASKQAGPISKPRSARLAELRKQKLNALGRSSLSETRGEDGTGYHFEGSDVCGVLHICVGVFLDREVHE